MESRHTGVFEDGGGTLGYCIPSSMVVLQFMRSILLFVLKTNGRKAASTLRVEYKINIYLCLPTVVPVIVNNHDRFGPIITA